MIHMIEAIDPKYRDKYPNGRTFTVCPLTPLVRQRLFSFFRVLLDEIPDKVVESFSKNTFDLTKSAKIVIDLMEYLEDSGRLERFVAVFIRDEAKSDRNKDMDEIAEYLTLNCIQVMELKIFADFFETISTVEILDTIQSMKTILTTSMSGLERR